MLANDENVERNKIAIEKLLLTICGNEEFPWFVSDKTTVFDVCSASEDELRQRIRAVFGQVVALNEMKMPLWRLSERLLKPTETLTEPFSFRLLKTDGAARRGEFVTPHGRVQTPAFMPVGTQGTVKSLHPEDVRETGAKIVLGNTYHLMLRPGAERIAALGGLHKFMNWPLPILTDSGGFQVMSLSQLRKLAEKGVTFRSHLDGTMFELTPERALEIQALLGADISMQLDECLKLPATREEMARAMALSLRWAERSKRAFAARAREGFALFGIVQGGDDLGLRTESARELTAMNFEGYAIGGLAVGEPQEVMLKIVAETTPILPADKPRYLMGVGTPHDLLEAVKRGIDMFDCVLPTRNGRHGMAFTRFGSINLSNARHANDPRPLDEESPHPAARTYSRAYLHHLTKANEILGQVLLSTINIAYYQALMAGMREAIAEGRFEEFRAETLAGWERGDLPAL